MRELVSWPGMEPRPPQHWEARVEATGPRGKSQDGTFLSFDSGLTSENTNALIVWCISSYKSNWRCSGSLGQPTIFSLPPVNSYPVPESRPGLASHPLLSQDPISMTDSDLGVTLGTLTLCPLLPFAHIQSVPKSYRFCWQTPFRCIHLPPALRALSYSTGQDSPLLRLPVAILPSKPPSTPSCLGNPIKHKPDHITCHLKTLQCLFTDIKKKTKNMKMGSEALWVQLCLSPTFAPSGPATQAFPISLEPGRYPSP